LINARANGYIFRVRNPTSPKEAFLEHPALKIVANKNMEI